MVCAFITNVFGKKHATAFPLFIPGKRNGRSSLAAAMTVTFNKTFFYECDLVSKRRFLVDTGAEISVLPATCFECLNICTGKDFLAANGSKIATLISKKLPIHLPEENYNRTFVVASVGQPFLGSDFLQANSLLVEVRHNHSVITLLFISTPIKLANQSAANLNALCLKENSLAEMLAEFPSITTRQFCDDPPKHGTQHYISTKRPPIHTRPRRLSPDKLAVAQ